MQPVAVKNRAPAPIQISAEQLVREAQERRLEEAPKAPKQYIADEDELRIYQINKEKDSKIKSVITCIQKGCGVDTLFGKPVKMNSIELVPSLRGHLMLITKMKWYGLSMPKWK